MDQDVKKMETLQSCIEEPCPSHLFEYFTDDETLPDFVELPLDRDHEHSGIILQLCNLALDHYHLKHPEESCEFISVLKAVLSAIGGLQYDLEFSAKNLKDNGDFPVIFEAIVLDIVGADGYQVFKRVTLN